MNKLILLTICYNEEENITYLLENCKNFVDDIYVLDSYSSDKTIEIVKKYTKNIFYKKFINYYSQREYLISLAKKNINDTANTWFLILDSDEYLSKDLISEIKTKINDKRYDAYYMNRRFIWKNTWIKNGGYYPLKLLRLIKAKYIKMDGRIVNEHYISQSKNIGYCNNDFYDFNRKNTKAWLFKHKKYAILESKMYFNKNTLELTNKRKLWNYLPILVRPFILLLYRLFYKKGFVDGFVAIQYHFLHSFVYRLVVDFYILKELFKKCIKK